MDGGIVIIKILDLDNNYNCHSSCSPKGLKNESTNTPI